MANTNNPHFEALGLREKKAALTKKKIADAFLSLMCVRGFDGFTVKELCASVDIAEANHHSLDPVAATRKREAQPPLGMLQ